MKKIYILTAVFALLTLSLNAQLKADQFGNVVQPNAQTGKVNAPNRADVLLSGCSWDVSTNGTTLPSGWTTTSNLSTNSDGSAYISSSSGGTITIPSSLMQGNSTVKVVINAASYNGTTYSLSVNNSAKEVYETSFSDYTWENVSATNGITITMNSWNVSLMSIKVYATSNDPFITATPNSITIQCAPNGTATETVAVTGLNLTDGITATISGTNASLFSVSPASLGTTGGSLTVTYSPTAVGTHTATLTLSSTGADPVTISLNGSCALKETICDGTNENGFLPIYGYYIDDYQINQMIYPEITSLIGKKLTSMTFYATTALDTKLSSVGWNVKLGTTTQNSFANALSSITRLVPDDVTTVAEGYVITSGINTMTITFTTPFEYNGGNLLVDFQSTAEGQYASASFYGVDQSTFTGYNSYRDGNATPNQNGHYSGGGVRQFLPKVTFTFEETGPKIVVSPETLTINDSGTNNTFTVQGSNLGTDPGVGVTPNNGFATTTSDHNWGFDNNNGSVSGTVTVTYEGRDLSATGTVNVANNLTSATVAVTYVPDLYIYCDGGVTPWNFSANPAIAMTNNGDGTYTATLQDIPDGSHILFGRASGLTYGWEGDENRLFIGASTDGGDWGYGDNHTGYLDTDPRDDYPVKYHPIYIPEGGSYTVTINANNYTFTIEKLVLPPPENVEATADDDTQSATVTWDAPSNLPTVTTTVTEQVTEGFDDTSKYEPFSLGGITADNHIGAINGWTLYDPTGASVWGVQNGSFTNMYSPHAWLVMNPSQATNVNITAYSPEQYMESICPVTDENTASDHWLISPELSGNAQTIEFYERIVTTQYEPYYETYEILVSSNDINSLDPSDGFTVLQTVNSEATTWTLRTFELPAGTKHFAIHHISNDVFGMMVDDVKYEATRTETVTEGPISYNVYLDGVLVGNVDANDPLTYTFNNVTAGVEHTAEISAVYPGNIESEKVADTFTITPKTDAPTISVTPGDAAYTITATAADPTAEVVMTVDGVEYRGTGSVSVTIDRGTTNKTVEVSATAKETDKLESDPAEQSVTVPMLPITPTPSIDYTTTNATVVITATGEGTVYLEVDGQTASGEGTVSITVMRSLDDRTVTATAAAVADNHQPSANANAEIPVPALAGNPATAKEGLLRMHLLVVDQFKEAIPDDNSHPDRYGYVLKWEEPANVADHKESGTVEVEIKKTEAQVNGYYTLSQVEADTNHDNSEITLDVLSADVGMYLPGEDPDVLYYEMQSKKDDNPELGQDYITQLQYIKNAQKYEEMLATSPNKTHQYPAEETYHYFDDSTPIITGTYGVNFMTYAPSVSTWGIQRRYFETDGLDNTYGAPIWKTGVGQVRVISTEAQLQRGPQGSTQWDGVGGPCSLVFLGVEAFGDLPSADVSNIQYEPYMFRVWVQSPGNYLRGCNLIGEHVDPNKPGEHWDGDGTCYGAVPVLVYEQLTTDGHLYKHVQSMEEGNNVEWGEKIQFGALDSGISDLIVYVRFYYRSTGHGISGTRFTLRGNRDGDDEGDETPEVPGYYASEGDANPDITTGINGIYTDLNKPIESVTYVNAQGMTNDQPFDGVNIVITRYTDGTMTTTKVVR